MAPCYGQLLDSGGVCSTGPYFVHGTYLVCIRAQLRGPYYGPMENALEGRQTLRCKNLFSSL